MALKPGTRLGPYQILSALGAGGIGEVAAVNHPHVCSLYDVGPDYLVMEYVEGESLRGPVPLAQALALADQIWTRSTPRTEGASSTAT